MGLIDLHTHSTASDGTLSPAELVRRAGQLGLSAIALTDHDTVQGLPEALAEGRAQGVEVVPGCELSVESEAGRPMHILRLFVPQRPENLLAVFSFMKTSRLVRNQRILDKLARLGIAIDYNEVEVLAGGTIGRPHIARVLVERGVAASFDRAFEEYLGVRGKAYVPKDKLTPQAGIAALKKDGALAVLAHPYLLSLPEPRLREMLVQLKSHGLDGLEVLYPEHGFEDQRRFRRLAEELGLAQTGGSDFHGGVKPDIELGRGRGNLAVPGELLEALKARLRDQGFAA